SAVHAAARIHYRSRWIRSHRARSGRMMVSFHIGPELRSQHVIARAGATLSRWLGNAIKVAHRKKCVRVAQSFDQSALIAIVGQESEVNDRRDGRVQRAEPH